MNKERAVETGGGCCGEFSCCGGGPSVAAHDPREMVKEVYGRIGAGETRGCGCGSREIDVSRQAGYSSEEIESVPAGANLGLGCGNPTALAGIIPGETVLDLGSGGGFDCFLAAIKTGPSGRVIGIDLTTEMIERARANAQAGGHFNVEFRQGDIEHLPVDDSSVDLVISNCVLNLVPEKERAFREIFRVLKPGGRIAVSDLVLLRSLPDWLRESAVAYTGCVSGALARDQYFQLLQEAGLKDIEIISEQDASEMFIDSTDPTINQLIAGRPLDDIRGLVASISLVAFKPE